MHWRQACLRFACCRMAVPGQGNTGWNGWCCSDAVWRQRFLDHKIKAHATFRIVGQAIHDADDRDVLPFQIERQLALQIQMRHTCAPDKPQQHTACRSEEHTSELQSLMRISYAVFCLKKKKTT